MVTAAATLGTWRSYQIRLTGLILAAWLTLVVWAMTPYAALLDHNQIEEGLFPAFVRWPAFLGGWTLMVVAMMLPSSLPEAKSCLRAAEGSNIAPGRVVWSFLLGYLAIWVAFGAAIYAGDTLLHEAVAGGLVPYSLADGIPVLLLAVAGAYQLTSLRRSCSVQRCLLRAPEQVDGPGLRALPRGLNSGLMCVGTCGTTMLVMFALAGAVNLAWMVALTVLALLERTSRGSKYVAWSLGIALLLLASSKLV